MHLYISLYVHIHTSIYIYIYLNCFTVCRLWAGMERPSFLSPTYWAHIQFDFMKKKIKVNIKSIL